MNREAKKKRETLSRVKVNRRPKHRKPQPKPKGKRAVAKKGLNHKLKRLAKSSRTRWVAAATLALFVIINVVVGVAYHDKTLPNTYVNQKDLSSVSYDKIPTKIDGKLLPSKVRLTHNNVSVEYALDNLGITVDVDKVVELSKNQHNKFLPILGLIGSRNIVAPTKIDKNVLQKAFVEIQEKFKKSPSDAKIVQINGNFSIQPEVVGYQLDYRKIQSDLSKINSNSQIVTLSAQPITPATVSQSLQPELDKLQKQRNTPITLKYQNKERKLTPQEIGTMYVQSGNTQQLSDRQIGRIVAGVADGRFGIKVENASQAVASIKSAIQSNKSLEFTLKRLVAKKTYRYCVQLKGVPASERGVFASKLVSTYADKRGWSLGGDVSFVEASSGCSFYVWLTSADQMTSFRSVCDSTWSCTVGSNVVINYTRWSNASPAWNGGGGSLDDYRSMVINHETGHWLGFHAHWFCNGAGQSAPVMQQQSISMMGCKVNPWPLPAEKSSLRAMLGI